MDNNNIQIIDKEFPIVRIIFGKTINSDSFEFLKQKWLALYLQNEYFYLIFDTSNLENMPFKYLRELSSFTSKLKKLETQYLKSSILLIKNNFIRNLYMFYLKLSKPISTLYIVENTIDMEIVANKLVNKETVTGYKQYNTKKN